MRRLRLLRVTAACPGCGNEYALKLDPRAAAASPRLVLTLTCARPGCGHDVPVYAGTIEAAGIVRARLSA